MSQRVKESDFSFIDDPLIRKHFAAQANQSTFRVTTHADIGTKGSSQVSEMQLVGDDMRFHSWQEIGGKKQGEMIAIGDTTYVKDAKENVWWKQTVKPEEQKEMDSQLEIKTEDFKEEYTKDRKMTYKKLGEESCGDLACYKYEEIDPESKEGHRIFWFDTKELLMRKEESGYGEWRGTSVYEYDGISVTAPSPVKEVPAGKSVYDYMYQGEPPMYTEPTSSNKSYYTAPKTVPADDEYNDSGDYSEPFGGSEEDY
jgi:hypothetical protein